MAKWASSADLKIKLVGLRPFIPHDLLTLSSSVKLTSLNSKPIVQELCAVNVETL